MEEAEKLAKKMDSVLHSTLRQVMSNTPKIPLQSLPDAFNSMGEKYKKLDFPSLNLLEKPIWPKSGKKGEVT
jgi:hypothetical protein